MTEFQFPELYKYLYRVSVVENPPSLRLSRLMRTVNQHGQGTQRKSGNNPTTEKKYSTLVTLPLPEAFIKERIIGKPICIGHQRDYIVIQYVTDSCKYSRFLLVDLCAKCLLTFEDLVGYFHKDHVLVGPVRCLINPSCEMLFMILHSRILSSHHWSNLPVARIEHLDSKYVLGNEDSPQPRCRISDVRSEGYRTRRNELIAFDPRFDAKAVSVIVDENCSRCKLLLLNMHTKKNFLQRTQKLISPSFASNEADSSGSDTVDLEFEMENNELKCSDLRYNCNGNMIVLLITFQQNSSYHHKEACAFKSALFVFDSDSLALLKRTVFSAATDLEQLTCFISCCDSEVAICSLQEDVIIVHTTETLPLQFDNLQSHCRHSINRCVKQDRIKDLPIPGKLVKFLRYDQVLIKCP